MSVAKDQKIELEIIDLGDGGEGIGRLDGLTFFVEGGLPGDVVEAVVTQVKKNFGIARLIKVVKPSENRIEPACPYFKHCGGCQIMSLDYEKGQKPAKEKMVRDALERIGGFKGIAIEPILGMDNPYRYRNKGMYPVAANGKLADIGFFKRGSHRVVDVRDCLLQVEAHGVVNQIVRDFVAEFGIEIYDEYKQTGILRHVMIRHSEMTGELMVVLVVNANGLVNESILKDRLVEALPNLASFVININKDKGNKVLGSKNRIVHGVENITESIDSLMFQISPLSFFQVNPVQTKVLYQKALEFADLKGKETVFDIYCGIGTISLFLAQKAKKVVGVELVNTAVKDAKGNAFKNGYKNCEFHVGKAEEVIPMLYETGYKADVVVVDPPRKGCDPQVIETIIKMAPDKIVYVSCKPSTLARDVKLLCENGLYEVTAVQPVDMFPQTVHVECVVKLEKR